MVEVVQTKEPCFRCKKPFKEGDELGYHIIDVVKASPWLKTQKKKLKKLGADTTIAFLVHKSCLLW